MDMNVAPAARSSLVKGMWSISGAAEEAVLPGVVAPDSHVEFVFHLGQPWRMRREGETSWLDQPASRSGSSGGSAIGIPATGTSSGYLTM